MCVSSVYFKGHRGPAPPLGGANQRAPKGRPTRTPLQSRFSVLIFLSSLSFFIID